MNIEFIEALEDMAKDRGIERDELYEMVEKGLQEAYKEQYDTNSDVDVEIDQNSGDIFVDGEQIELGQFGRIASKKAEDVIRQLIREKQNELVYESYAKRKGEVVNGSIHRFEGSDVWLNLGEVEGLLPGSERIPGERYQQGGSLRAYLYFVEKKPGGLVVRVSRAKKEFVAKLMEIEIPEIEDELLEIVDIAREPGKRSKVAVRSLDDQIDPVGTCVGAGGSRVKEITDELNGEKIDVIHWSDDRERLIRNSLEPASVLSVEFNENDRGEEVARVLVPKDDLAYAIGQNGQNVRLTVELAGCDIDVRSPESE
ncbi:transcription termination factor NusA [Candidatus Bipolaricaulota bacterium]|nr:transcription termination factor NusA [Candidatus Bipolaricaulota bacterium]MBS3814204.1 transcription termination factor NusA [Candidatus Bipolaricaulota bacterium]MBS3825265.1 transcription termination factor NusA [Candidatus Bipolaricaulota bacterium]